jgi:uncharacterized damage-inducible protein DinB
MTMKKTVLAFTVLAFTATTAAAQDPVSDALRGSWNGVKRNIRESAEQMPEENYSFKPSPDVRTFGQILAHVAGASYVFCASAKGEKTPFAEDYFEKNATTRAAIIKATNDAIDYCDGAYLAVTDANAGQAVRAPFSSGSATRASSLIGQIGHDNEHYGNLVTYFRIKGMVPPSSKR